MKKVILFVAMIALMIYSTTSSALGEREKGVLIGIGTSIVYDRVFRNGGFGYPGSYPGTYGNNGAFPQFRCSHPNPQSVQCSYERGVYERERQIWQEEKNAAYRCGRFGECDNQ